MEKKVLDCLKNRLVEMEAEVVISETLLTIINNMQIPGAQAQQYAQQKQAIEASNHLNKLLVAELKEKLDPKKEGK